MDLRGLTIAQPERVRENEYFERITRIYEFKRVKIRDVDFSYATLPEWRVLRSSFENCVFDCAKLPSFRAYSAKFKRCMFRTSDLREASLGARAKRRKAGGLYEDCDFSGADLREVSTDHGRFIRCDFQWTEWKDTRFLSTFLESCDFSHASIVEAVFDGRRFRDHGPDGLSKNKLTGCDFSTAQLHGTSFLAIDFRNCIPPCSENAVLVGHYRRKVEQALSYLKTCTERPKSAIVEILQDEFKFATKFLPDDAVGLIQFDHFPGDYELVMKAFELTDR